MVPLPSLRSLTPHHSTSTNTYHSHSQAGQASGYHPRPELAGDPCSPSTLLQSSSSSTNLSGASLEVHWCFLEVVEPLESPLAIAFFLSGKYRPPPPLVSSIASSSSHPPTSHRYRQVRRDPLSTSIPL